MRDPVSFELWTVNPVTQTRSRSSTLVWQDTAEMRDQGDRRCSDWYHSTRVHPFLHLITRLRLVSSYWAWRCKTLRPMFWSNMDMRGHYPGLMPIEAPIFCSSYPHLVGLDPQMWLSPHSGWTKSTCWLDKWSLGCLTSTLPNDNQNRSLIKPLLH